MRRSFRKLSSEEAVKYIQGEELLTASSLDEARMHLSQNGLEPTDYCYFSWMRDGVRYYRLWEDKRVKEGVAKAVPFGQVAAGLKRAAAENLYILAKRYKGSMVKFNVSSGVLHVAEAESGEVKAVICVPQTGGNLVFEQGAWNAQQAVHFVNVLLIRRWPVDQAYREAAALIVS